jgi:thiazole synthase
MLELCLRSRALYPSWIQKLEDLTGLSTGYWPCGILAPVYDLPQQGDRSKNLSCASGHWLDQASIQFYQPGLGPEVIGGWCYPEEGQVDNRALAKALLQAAQTAGVEWCPGIQVTGWDHQDSRITQVWTNSGTWQADHYVLASGAWSHQLLPIPVLPCKGQMLSVRLPLHFNNCLPLQQILFGPGSYIVPRQNGQIVIGATAEWVGFREGNTPAGLQTLLQKASRMYPGLQEFPVEHLWSGYRPATPDELPILGPSHCANLTLATGHYRNGILLAPVTAQLIADWLQHKLAPEAAHALVTAFGWERFQTASRPSSTQVWPHCPQLNSYPTAMQSTPVLEKPSDLLGDRPLVIAGRSFRSRLMTGTGKYRNFGEMSQSVTASGCEIITVAVRRVESQAPGHVGLAEALNWQQLWMLPNTAGCKTAEEAIRVARLGRAMAKALGQDDNNFVKLEVIPDPKYLLPDPIGTLEAAEQLVKEGFAVLPYINADPMLAKRLENAGCATVMPLGSPIGSGQGLKTLANLQIIIENAQIPVVVDAGIGTPSEAAQAMELGADALLINSAIALAQNPVQMARAMKLATEAGRLAYLAGRIPIRQQAIASSPLTGMIAQEVTQVKTV